MKDFMQSPFFAALLDSLVLTAQNFSQIPSGKPTPLQIQEIQQDNVQHGSAVWKKGFAAFKYIKYWMIAALKEIASRH